MTNKSIIVNYFQRKPRKGFSFSLESIFDDIRQRLEDRIHVNLFISKCFNDGYFTKFVNIIEAALRQNTKNISHITGELHFLNLLMRKKKVIVTIHDCGMIHRKTGWTKYFVEWLYLRAPEKKTTLITTVSEATKNEIIHYTGCNPDKIKVIPVAVNPQYQPIPKVFNSEKPIILQIGTGYNKNIVRLIEAISGIPCHLTIVGSLGHDHITALKKYAIDFSNEYNISNERLLEKYIECDILSFVSTFEGFGIPIIEANAVERVVVTSNISSMPEVAGDAACLVNPESVESIRAGILRVIQDDHYRDELIAKGRMNKQRFDPDIIAGMYFSLYNQLANNKFLS